MTKVLNSLKECFGLERQPSPEEPSTYQIEKTHEILSSKPHLRPLPDAINHRSTKILFPPIQPSAKTPKDKKRQRKPRTMVTLEDESKIPTNKAQMTQMDAHLKVNDALDKHPLHKAVTHRDLPSEVFTDKAVQTNISGPISKVGKKKTNPSKLPIISKVGHLKKVSAVYTSAATDNLSQRSLDNGDAVSQKSIGDTIQKNGLPKSEDELIESMLQNTNADRRAVKEYDDWGEDETTSDGLIKSDLEMIEEMLKEIGNDKNNTPQEFTCPVSIITTPLTRKNRLPPLVPNKVPNGNTVSNSLNRPIYVASCESLSWIPDSLSPGPPTPLHKDMKPCNDNVVGGTPLQPTPPLVRPKAAPQISRLPSDALPYSEPVRQIRVRPRAALPRNRQAALRGHMSIVDIYAANYQVPAMKTKASTDVLKSPPRSVADKYLPKWMQ